MLISVFILSLLPFAASSEEIEEHKNYHTNKFDFKALKDKIDGSKTIKNKSKLSNDLLQLTGKMEMPEKQSKADLVTGMKLSKNFAEKNTAILGITKSL